MLPDVFYNGLNLAVNADKQSNLYVANRDGLGGFNGNANCVTSFNNVQCITTPPIPQNDPTQGYWASPAYWKYTSGSTTNYMLYYSATMQSTTAGVAPEAINGYQLLTGGSSGPIPTTYASTTTLFCDYSPTPSVSSNSTASTSGIVWAIERQNSDNPSKNDCNGTFTGHAALHAFNASISARRSFIRAGAPTPRRQSGQSQPSRPQRFSKARCTWERKQKLMFLACAAPIKEVVSPDARVTISQRGPVPMPGPPHGGFR